MIDTHVTVSIDPWTPCISIYSFLKLTKTFSIEVCLLQSNANGFVHVVLY